MFNECTKFSVKNGGEHYTRNNTINKNYELLSKNLILQMMKIVVSKSLTPLTFKQYTETDDVCTF